MEENILKDLVDKLAEEENSGIRIENVVSLGGGVHIDGQNLPSRAYNNGPTHTGIQKNELGGGQKKTRMVKKTISVEVTLSGSKQESKSVRRKLRSTKSKYHLEKNRDKKLVCSTIFNAKKAAIELQKLDYVNLQPGEILGSQPEVKPFASNATVSKECDNQSKPSVTKVTNFQLPDDQSKTEERSEKLPNQEKENTVIPNKESDVNKFEFLRLVLDEPESENLEMFREIPASQPYDILSVNSCGIETKECTDPSHPSTSETLDSIMELDPVPEMQMRPGEAARSDSDASDSHDHLWRRHERWSEEAKKVVFERFRKFIKKRKSPGLKRCRDLIELEPHLFKGRTAAHMNSLISNWLHGKSIMPSDEFLYDSDNELTLYDVEEEEEAGTRHYFPKRKWSREAKELVITAFADFIKNRVNPGHEQCRLLICKNPTVLRGRTPIQVNVLVDNWLRGKAKPPPQFSHLFPVKK